MPTSLLSRFDLIFILVDTVDESRDKLISEHIMNSHRVSNSSGSNAGSAERYGYSQLPLSSQDQTQSGVEQEDFSSRTLNQQLRAQCSKVANMLNSQSANRSNFPLQLLPPDVFRKYIEYAKMYVHPRLTPVAAKVLQKFYLTMRSEALIGNGTIPVTTRNLESLIRLAQARAKMELREEV